MKKKFFTLLAAAVLGISSGAYAQSNHVGNGEISYRSTITKSASLDDFFWKVDQFKEGEYYQLVVNRELSSEWGGEEIVANSPSWNVKENTHVLTQERDYSTGKLYLAVKPIQEATLVNSLWRIQAAPSGDVNGRAYTFINKATGVALAFDDEEAVEWSKIVAGDIIETADLIDTRAGNLSERLRGSKYSPSVIHGGVNTWTWYTNYSNPSGTPFKQKVVWSYFHAQKDSVVGLALVSINDRTADSNSTTWDGKGKDKAEFGRSYVVAVKGSQQELKDISGGKNGVNNGIDFITLQPVNAGAKVLNAAEINSMIDSDGSYLSFTKDDSYSPNYTYTQPAGMKVSFKVTPNNFEGNVLLGNTFTAVESDYKSLVRTQYEDGNIEITKSKNKSIYAGYNILLKDASGKYLYVSEEPYDRNNTALTNDLKVVLADLPATFQKANKLNAHDARYHWKVTYYASNDSVVFEPLNASRMTTEELKAGKKFPESALADAEPTQFFNTINRGEAYNGGCECANAYYNKSEGVPVALYALNNSVIGDSKLLLTVGVPGQINQDEYQWTVYCKFESTELSYNTVEYNEAELHDSKEQRLNKYTVAGNNPAYVTNGPCGCGENGGPYVAQQYFKLGFNSTYTYLNRATLENGLYFLNLKTDKSNETMSRRNGSYLAYNLYGDLMYDSPGAYQDFGNMPAAQFVVEQLPCTINDATPEVSIRNREYGADHELFRGQLYKDEAGDLFIINHRDYYLPNIANNDNQKGMFDDNKWSCKDTIKFTKVSKTEYPEAYNETHGYKRFDSAELLYETWSVYYNSATIAGAPSLDRFLSFNSKTGQLAIHDEVYPDFEVETVADLNEFGYTGASLPQLKRQTYVLKVRDNNLIDNNWKYVVLKRDAVNKLSYYSAVHLEDVDGVEIKLAKFYFKADQVTAEGEPAYAFVDVNENRKNPDFKKEGWLTFLDDLTNVNPEDAISNYYTYAGRAFKGNGFRRFSVIGEEADARPEELQTIPTSNVSAFVFVREDRPLYKPLNLAEGNKAINIFENLIGASATGKQYLFENGNNQGGNIPAGSYIKDLGYLGITSESTIQPVGKESTTAMYADSVISSGKYMPQYLFFVAPDSVRDGRWCTTNAHGYFPSESSADQSDKSHHEFYNGYVAGRVLVNLNDSVSNYTSINKLDFANMFKYENYVRLAFVEAIHTYIAPGETENEQLFGEEAGEYLYILKGIKLADLKTTIGTYNNVIDPTKFKKAVADGKIVKNVLDGKHKNYAFSLRYTDDQHVDFLMESNDIAGESAIASFKGAWVKIHNGVPVLAQTSSINGQHGTIVPVENLKELVNQAKIFNTEDTNNAPVANEDINVTAVKVVAGNGNVTILNAAGKTVTISNILGQTVANTTISSDNVTIAAPKGIVVVAVQGEDAVKAIVK